MPWVVVGLVVLMLVRSAVGLRHHPTPSRLLLLLFWMAALAYTLVPSPLIFSTAIALMALALAARLFPEPAARIAERLGLRGLEAPEEFLEPGEAEEPEEPEEPERTDAPQEPEKPEEAEPPER